MSDNLPPGVTPSDIDRHFGAPETEDSVVFGDVTVGVSVEVPDDMTTEKKENKLLKKALDGEIDEVLDVEVVHEEPAP